MNANQICSRLLTNLLLDPTFADTLASVGIKPQDWPAAPWGTAQINVRKVGMDYVRHRESNGHDYAVWKALQAVSLQDLERQSCKIPETPSGIYGAYLEAMREHRAQALCAAILKSPGNVDELIQKFQQQSLSTGPTRYVDMAEETPAQHAAYVQRVYAGTSVVTVPMWIHLSECIGGFNPGRVGLCKADSGFGKSTLAFNISYCAAQKFPVLYVNMEMALQDMYERYFAMLEGKNFNTLRREGPSPLDSIHSSLKVGSLFMTDGRDMSFAEIRAIARQISNTSPVKLIIVDYDQKLILDSVPGSSEWKEVQKVMARFEDLAKELGCFILVLAQTNYEGNISSSHRARFSASTIWNFHNDDEHGPVISFDKNRFMDRQNIILVNYEGWCGRITEMQKIKAQQGTTTTKRLKR